MGGKYAEAVQSGIIGALIVPTSLILLYAAMEIFDQMGGISGAVTAQDQYMLIFFIWALVIVPLTLLLVGVLSSGLASKYGSGIFERSLLSAIAGIIAIAGGVLLFLFVSAFLSPADITSQLADRLSSFMGSMASLAIDPLAWAAMALYVLIAVVGSIVYGVVAQKKDGVERQTVKKLES